MRVVPWWLILIQGVALIILGILFLTNPASTALAVVTVLGIYWLISGILGIIGIFLNSHNWFWKLLMGILGIVAGVLILQHPITTTLVVGATLVLWLGLLGIMIGVIEIIRGITGEGWAEVILGIVSIILGGLLLANWGGVTISLPWSLGILALIGGVVAIFNAFRARGIQQDMEAGTDELTNKYRATVATADAKIDAAADRVRAAGGATAAAAAATGAAGVAAAERAARSTGDALSDAANATAGVDRAVDSAADAVGDAYDATADAVGDAADAVEDAFDDAGDAVGDMASRASGAIDVSMPTYNIPAAVGALTAEDKLAVTSWAREQGITEDEVQRIMASPYGDLLARGKTPAERAALARELGVDDKKILTYLNLADLQRINGVGMVYAYLLEESGVDTVKELATRNPANLTAKLAEVNAVRGITKRVPPQGEVENWVAEAKTMLPALEY
jgi:uncharacterized membrane protein HdeD (DUF308 family)/predicted flap endonuclease-1-like 5' DNA nuclease